MTNVLYILAAVCLAGAAFLGLDASDTHDATVAERAQNAGLQNEVQQLQTEKAQLESVEPFPLRFSQDALSEFFSRSLEDGEVLGAGVRMEPRGNTGSNVYTFAPLRDGVETCPVTIRAAMEGAQAPAILALFEEDLAALPVTVKKVKADIFGKNVSVIMDVDVFGRPRQ